MGAGVNAWGTSWGTSWGASWSGGVVPPVVVAGSGGVPWFWYSMPRQKREKELEQAEIERKRREKEVADAMRAPLPTTALRFTMTALRAPPPAVASLAKLRTSNAIADARALAEFEAFLLAVVESETA
jgi:hypothetical protein